MKILGYLVSFALGGLLGAFIVKTKMTRKIEENVVDKYNDIFNEEFFKYTKEHPAKSFKERIATDTDDEKERNKSTTLVEKSSIDFGKRREVDAYNNYAACCSANGYESIQNEENNCDDPTFDDLYSATTNECEMISEESFVEGTYEKVELYVDVADDFTVSVCSENGDHIDDWESIIPRKFMDILLTAWSRNETDELFLRNDSRKTDYAVYVNNAN